MDKDVVNNKIESYNKSAKNYAQKHTLLNNYDDTFDLFSSYLNENDLILDLACGTGQISKYINTKVKVKTVGLDLSVEMLKIAQNENQDAEFI